MTRVTTMVVHIEPRSYSVKSSGPMNKDSGGDEVSAELFQILKVDAVKVLYSICQQIWKIQQFLKIQATGQEKIGFHPNPKERQYQRM